MVMREHFNEELSELHNMVLRMGSVVEESIDRAIDSLLQHDMELAEVIIKDDDIPDNMELEIQDKCVTLIATQQPLAKDLRTICAALKISTDLERIGDYAVDIAKTTIRLNGQNYIKPLIDIPQMAKTTIGMIKDALDSYVNENVALAEEVCTRDDVIDGIYRNIFHEMISIMMDDNSTILQAMYLLLVARYIERIADHTTNICEWVIYTVTGEKKNLND
jgi:phosphate transport system protein